MKRIALAALLFVPLAASAQEETGRSGSDLINTEAAQSWTNSEAKVASKAGDLEFLRRVTLDLTGTVPTLARTKDFMADTSSRKREKLVDELLASDRFVQNWADEWTDLLMNLAPVVRGRDQYLVEAFRGEVVERLKRNQPWNEFVNELLTTRGSWSNEPEKQKEAHDGLVGWYQQFSGGTKANVMAGALSKTFLGIQVQCAECHDHPFDKWTQEDFKGMAAFFTRMQPVRERIGEKPDPKDKKRMPEYYTFSIRDEKPAAVAEEPKKKPARPVKNGREPENTAAPKFLETNGTVAAGVTRRQSFADQLTSKENKQFARAFVNRMWAHFFGKGIVHPYDDFTLRTKPVIPALMEALAADFTEHGYDTRWLMRAIVLSKPYQLASAGGKERDAAADKYFGRARIRNLTPEQFYDAIIDATGARGQAGAQPQRGEKVRGGVGDAGKRAFIQALRGGARNEGDSASDPELGVPQALYLMNGQFVDGVLKARPGTLLDGILKAEKTEETRVESLYLAILVRKPSQAELRRDVAYVIQARSRPAAAPQQMPGGRGQGRPNNPKRANGTVDKDLAAFEDLVWVLLNSTEFMTNH